MPVPSNLLTRIAPTPSGYLHVGNAWSFLLTWLLARSQGGKIHLRIDDLDAARFREEYLVDIFTSLEWLGIDWDSGPKTPIEFHSSFSQRHRRSEYRETLERLLEKSIQGSPIVYACQCSREQVKRASLSAGLPGIYPGTCQRLGLPRVPAKIWQSGKGVESPGRETVLRLNIPPDTTVTLKDEVKETLVLRPREEIGDFILWQRNGEPSYQLASLVDDQKLGINYIVRGRDLLSSTGVQAYLAGLMDFSAFSKFRFYHHGLVLGPGGEKLSKSSGRTPAIPALSLAALRQRPGGRAALMGYFASSLGLSRNLVDPRGILSHFSFAKIPVHDLNWHDLGDSQAIFPT
jgi:glutamyl/glutaminyl-tRNA synthetase